MLIGDPKQAIYAFRGADVYSYLAAAKTAGDSRDARGQPAQRPGADRRLRRDVRRRQARPRGDRLRAGAGRGGRPAPRLLGVPRSAAAGARGRPLRSGDRDDARRASPGAELARGHSSRATWRRISCGCCSGARSSCARGPATSRCWSATTAPRGALVRDALDDVGVPSVINGAGSVFATPAAREWLRLLEALERPASPRAGARGDDDVVPRAGPPSSVAARVRRGVGGRPPPPARLGGGAAPARAGVADGDDHARRAAAGAGAGASSTASAG